MQWRSTRDHNPEFDVLCSRLRDTQPHVHDSTLTVSQHVKDRRNNLFQSHSKAFGKEPNCQGYRRAFLGGFLGVQKLSLWLCALTSSKFVINVTWERTASKFGRNFDTRLPDYVVSSTLKITDYPTFRMSANEFHVPV
jgi:hypothetical protein